MQQFFQSIGQFIQANSGAIATWGFFAWMTLFGGTLLILGIREGRMKAREDAEAAERKRQADAKAKEAALRLETETEATTGTD